MTHQDKINLIRQAVIKANPSIMELDFGCHFFFKGNNNGCVALSNKDWKRLHFMISLPLLEPKYDTLNRQDLIEEDALEILGRPIRLADCLNALWLGEFDSNENLRKEQEKVHQLAVMWNLLKDDLNEQSPETITFLYHLLIQGENEI